MNAGLRVRRTRLSVETTFTGGAPFENIADLRRHFRRFLTDNRASDTVVFDCLFDTEIVRAKVFMTRAYEVDHDHASGIVVMDIRQLAE